MEKLRRFQESPVSSLFTLLALLAFVGMFAGHFHLHDETHDHHLETSEHHEHSSSKYQVHTASCAVCIELAHSFLAKDRGPRAWVQFLVFESLFGSPPRVFKLKHQNPAQPPRAPPYSA